MDGSKSFAINFRNGKNLFAITFTSMKNGPVQMNLKTMLLANSKKLASADNFLALTIIFIKAN